MLGAASSTRGIDWVPCQMSRIAALVLVLCFTMNLLARGVSETYVVFLLPLREHFDWTRSEVTSVYSLYMLVHGLASPLAGLLFDRLGPRATYCTGLTALGGGYLLAAHVDSLWGFYACVGFLGGVGVATLSMVPASGLVSRWFQHRLGTAMGIVYAGLGCGVIMLVPVTQMLIERAGWRAGYLVLGGGLLALLPVLALLPWRQMAAGRPVFQSSSGLAGSGSVIGRHEWTLREAVRTRAFWSLFAVFFFTSTSIYTVSIQAVAYLVDVGFAALGAAAAFGVSGFLAVAGMIGAGWLSDIIGRRLTMLITYSLTVAGIAALLALGHVANPVPALLVAFVVCFGVAQGTRGPVVSAVAAQLFPGRGLGTIYGAITMGIGVGAAVGSWMSGFLYDLTGAYDAGFALSIAAALSGLAIFSAIPRSGEAREPGA